MMTIGKFVEDCRAKGIDCSYEGTRKLFAPAAGEEFEEVDGEVDKVFVRDADAVVQYDVVKKNKNNAKQKRLLEFDFDEGVWRVIDGDKVRTQLVSRVVTGGGRCRFCSRGASSCLRACCFHFHVARCCGAQRMTQVKKEFVFAEIKEVVRGATDPRQIQVNFGPPEHLPVDQQVNWKIQRPYSLACSSSLQAAEIVESLTRVRAFAFCLRGLGRCSFWRHCCSWLPA